MADVADKVRELISKHVVHEEKVVNDNSHLIDDLGADSLDIVELVMAIEEEFEIEIPDKDADQMSTVKDVVEYVADKTKAGGV
jgi:acyl carrier protein